MKKGLTAIVTALMLTITPAIAQQQTCISHEMISEILSSQHGETLQSRGLSATVLIEVWANLKKGTWTITATRPDGIACLVASGYAFELMNEPLLEGDPT